MDNFMENQMYKLAKSDTHRAILAVLLLAQDNKSMLTTGDIKATFKKLGIKTSAQRTAIQFFKPFCDGEVWYNFPFISNQRISEAYSYYLNKAAQDFYHLLRHSGTLPEKAKDDLIEELQDENRTLRDDNASMSRMGWRQQMEMDEMREAVAKGARRTLNDLAQSFKNLNIAISTTESRLGHTRVDLDSKTKKLLRSQTDDDIADLLRRYSDPAKIFTYSKASQEDDDED
jgi:hypothetical protein